MESVSLHDISRRVEGNILISAVHPRHSELRSLLLTQAKWGQAELELGGNFTKH